MNITERIDNYLNEGVIDKIKKSIGDLDRYLDADTRTPKELVQGIRDLSDETLSLWYKHRVAFAGWKRMFQDKAVQREMKKRGLMTEGYGKTYAKGKDEWYDVEKDGRKILKKAMADVKRSLKVGGSSIYDGGKRYQFSQYDDFTLGYKEGVVGSRDFSVVVMTTDGDGEIFVKDTKSMLAAIKKIQSRG